MPTLAVGIPTSKASSGVNILLIPNKVVKLILKVPTILSGLFYAPSPVVYNMHGIFFIILHERTNNEPAAFLYFGCCCRYTGD